MNIHIGYSRNRCLFGIGIFAILSASLAILMAAYIGLCTQKSQQYLLRIGWAGLVFIFLSLFFISMHEIFSYSIYCLFRRIKRNGLSSNNTIDINRRLFLSQIAQNGFVLISAVSTGHAMANTPNFPVMKEKYLYIRDLSADLEGFRIVHLSDIHADIYTTYYSRKGIC